MVREHQKQDMLLCALLFGVLCAMLWGVWSLNSQRELASKVVRLHVLANSDSREDQALKLQVRDAVLSRTEEILRASGSRAEAERSLRAALPELRQIARQALSARGSRYGVTARLEQAEFPTRTYDGFTLPAGRYLALRIVIGSGGGHNWWCVVFPPLCTASSAELTQTAMAAGLDERDVGLITEDGGGYLLKFKSIELWETLRARAAALGR